jgi:outer membrane protein TolC
MKKHKPYLILIACVLAAVHETAAAAQGNGASLEGALRSLFTASPSFHVYDVQTRQADALHLGAQGAFDLVAGAGVQAQRTLWSAPYGGLTNDGANDAVVQASLSTHTPENVGVTISGSTPIVSSIDPSLNPDQPQATANMTIPLLKFGRATSFGAEERAAALHATATAALQEDAESEVAMRVAESYWQWVGSYQQLEVTRRLEALAVDQLKDVDQMIEQHARATVDRLAFAAAAEEAAANRTQAEQLLFEQQQAVWETLGLPAPATATVPSDPLPDVPGVAPVAAVLSRHAHQLAMRRPLLAYLDRETASTAVRAEGLRIAKRPDVNLVAQGTAARVESSLVPTDTLLGYYGSVALQFSLPLENRRARGAYDFAAEVHAEQVLDAEQRRNAVDVRIDALGNALANLARSYTLRTHAFAQYQAEYEAERSKFRLGTATALDVVVAERQYMSANLALVADRTAYALTLAKLLHESGALGAVVHSRDPAAVVRRLADSAF